MRISHSHKFVFFAIPRTGSTTVRNILDKYSDIKSRHISQIDKEFPFYHHISASELKVIFDKSGWEWESYKKFCVIRNPYDRVVSLYHHFMKNRELSSYYSSSIKNVLRKLKYSIRPINNFEDYVLQINTQKRLQTSLLNFISDKNGNILIDDILKFEDLTKVLPEYFLNFGIHIKSTDIPHLNASENRFSYERYYSEKIQNRVKKLYNYEIERFHYEFYPTKQFSNQT